MKRSIKRLPMLVMVVIASTAAAATTDLADQPVAATVNVPGNLALTLSVEYPTAVSVAHTNRTYTPSSEYLGYFDPNKCYDYRYSSSDSTTSPNTTAPDSYFYPTALASAHVCSGKWSGNFLNWASMQTIDTFRYVLSGGYRVIDTSSLSVLEKAWASGQGGTANFPDGAITDGTALAGATPFSSSNVPFNMRIQGLGNKMRFALPVTSNAAVSFNGKYYNNTGFTGSPALTRTDSTINFNFNGGSPGPGVNATNIGIVWTATFTAPATGAYTFQEIADDTAKLIINGNTVINQTGYVNNNAQNSSPINFNAGDTINLELDFTQGGGGSDVYLNWSTPLSPGTFSPIGAPIPRSVNSGSSPTAYQGSNATQGTVYEVFMRAKVCDPSNGGQYLESNCTAYGSNYKPEGLLQQYANKIRFAVFGYLNDGNILRDGGVLRAKMKSIGPLQPVPGSTSITNPAAEWSASTGVFTLNPNATDATATGNGAVDSGVTNYLNKFGETAQSYKTFDPVGELYYSAVRYFKNQGNVPEYTASLSNSNVDGFPVITTWDDPIQYSCQRNFILGIGDTNTHADANLPGASAPTANEPTREASVTGDTTVDAIVATNKVGALEAASTDPNLSSYAYVSSNLGNLSPSSYWCCNNNSFGMAGLAYDSHTKDIRPNDFKNASGGKPVIQTISTYWVDVLEGQIFRPYNQYWLAAKYGGFTVPNGYSPYTATTPPATNSWYTNTDKINTDGTVASTSTFPRPDHYFTGNSPAAMRSGLISAFADIASSISASSTAFSTSVPQVQLSGNVTYAASYNAQDWSGSLIASSASFDKNGNPTFVQQWNARDVLTTQAAVNGTVKGWDTGRIIATSTGLASATATGVSTATGVPFRIGSGGLSTVETAALVTSGGLGTAQNLLNYLRGDQSNEGTLYRARNYLLGDIVDSKVAPIAAPNAGYSDSNNPGYSSFKSARSSRPTVVYVGANDGMMHAFNGAVSGSNQGQELFAYMPSFAIYGPTATPAINGAGSLANLSFTHHYLVDSTPVVYDIDFGKAGTATAGTVDWHSVLIGGLGKGGKGYYAIDVTAPENITTETALAGKVLWEFSNAKMGYSFGPPIVAKTRKYGWVVMLTSGYNNTDGQGYLFILNPKTGALLETITTSTGSLTNPSGLTYASAYIVDYSDFTAESVYAGDLLGNLWRFDLTGTGTAAYPAPVKLASFVNAAGDAQPVTSRPLVEIDPQTLVRYVAVGTGRLLASSDTNSSSLQSFYAIKDGNRTAFSTASTLPSGVSFPIVRANLTNDSSTLLTGIASTTSSGWYVDFGSSSNIAQRVVIDATANFGVIGFAALQPGSDPCNPAGNSTGYAVALNNGKSALVQGSTAIASVAIPGAVTELSFVNVAGRVRLEAGNDQGVVTNVSGNFDGITGAKRLNWREIPIGN